MPAGAVAWWKAEGDARDAVGTHDGTLGSGAGYASGQVGSAFSFDGSTNGYVQAPDSGPWAFGDADFGVELWVKWNTYTAGTWIQPGSIFVGNDEGPGSLNKWFFGLGAGYLYFHINSPSLVYGKFLAWTPFTPQVGQWYHLAVARNGGTLTIYTNGIAAGVTTPMIDTVPNASAPLSIGQAEGIGRINGEIDEPSIYSQALTSQDVWRIYSAGAQGKCAPVADTDADGLPDSWEMQYFGNLNQAADGDYDGDGFSNLEEYRLGTDPTVANLRLTISEPKGGAVVP
jgi:Concanavalin A-like lectin/glucanases superfamily/Bacterial TSP3 repeat